MQVLPPENNLLQYYLNDTEQFTQDNLMKINPKKSQVILFNKSRNWDFLPEVSFSDGKHLESVSEMKLVGVVISSDLRWEKNTQYICEKATQKLWTLRRMKLLNLDEDIVIDTYMQKRFVSF